MNKSMETTNQLKGIIFDLDGTLGNTLPVVFAAFQSALKKFSGRQYTNEEIASYFGATEEGMIQQIVRSQWQDCLQSYLEEYEKEHAVCDQPFPGMETALSICKQQDIALAVVTGKGKYSTAISLRCMGLVNYFDIVETGSADGAIKPLSIQNVLKQWKIVPQSVAYLGDAPYDMQAAKEAGVIPLGAAWAETASFQLLDKMSPTRTFRTVDNFIDWIRGYCKS
ncbi:MAG: HAD family hydrolase [Nostochopsis sp.]